MSFLGIGLAALLRPVTDGMAGFMNWPPIPLRALEPSIPSRMARRRQAQAWFLSGDIENWTRGDTKTEPPWSFRCSTG